MATSLYLADSSAIGTSTGRKVVRAADEDGKRGILNGLSENSEHTDSELQARRTSNDSEAIAEALHKAG